MKVWITRAEPGASRTAERLKEAGHEPVVGPLLTLRPLPFDARALSAAGSLALTSANAVPVVADAMERRDLPVLAVGDATARAAREAGFRDVRSAAGDVKALAAMTALARPPEPVIHAAAAEPAGDLAGDLATAGLRVQTVVVYRMDEAAALPEVVEDAEAILLHSPRAARVLAHLATPRLRRVPTAALSGPVADPVLTAGFTRVAIAATPDEAALLAALGSAVARP